MSEKGADRAGNKLANAAIIASIGILLVGLSFVLKVFIF